MRCAGELRVLPLRREVNEAPKISTGLSTTVLRAELLEYKSVAGDVFLRSQTRQGESTSRGNRLRVRPFCSGIDCARNRFPGSQPYPAPGWSKGRSAVRTRSRRPDLFLPRSEPSGDLSKRQLQISTRSFARIRKARNQNVRTLGKRDQRPGQFKEDVAGLVRQGRPGAGFATCPTESVDRINLLGQVELMEHDFWPRRPIHVSAVL
jgi:hypothetical protein